MPAAAPTSGIRDNHPPRGSVGDFLKAELKAGADLDLVTAYFTIFAYDKLRPQLDNLGRIRLLFGEAAFIKSIDPDNKQGAAFVLRDDGLTLANGLNQRHLARACAKWMRDKVEVRSVTKTGFLHGKMSHITRGEVTAAILGSSNFTTRGLGLAGTNNNVELNLVVDSNRDRADLHAWFEELWNDASRVEDVKAQVLDYQDKILGGFTQEGREAILIAMMKINFLKRLESSVDSFRLTLQRTIAKINTLEDRITKFEKHLNENPEIDYDSLTPEDFEDPDFDGDDLTIGGRRRIHLGHLALPRWLKAVRNDRTQLQFLLELTESVTAKRDGKLHELKAVIEAKATGPTLNRDGKPNRKVLVFTAFADTARYLYDHLSAWAQKDLKIHAALVCGDGGNAATLGRTDFDDILTTFSPVSKRRSDQKAAFPDQRQEIDLLIATDCISEGQNLQDCDLLVNYDIHWNPVRIIQRFGRIDRIGSRNKEVHLVNFWPVADLDRYLGVKHRVEARMALVDLAATQTDNLLDTTQLEELIKEDLLFRDRQLKRLKDEVLDLEDLDESVSLTDFSLDEFRQDLLNFLQAHKAELERAPLGLYAVVPPDPAIPMAQPGVIYCLRQKTNGGSPTNQRINPLHPHYLVYVREDGDVRLAFVQAKTTLNLFRSLALGKCEPFYELCRLFDRRTEQGADMRAYTQLVGQAVSSITNAFQERLAAGLQGQRSFTLPTESEQPREDSAFELVTWLVVLAPATGA